MESSEAAPLSSLAGKVGPFLFGLHESDQSRLFREISARETTLAAALLKSWFVG
jgi:hypothetical protein